MATEVGGILGRRAEHGACATSVTFPCLPSDSCFTIGVVAADVPLGEQIKAARERAHLTQQQLADLLGVDRKTVDNWENHRTSPRNRMGALIAWAPELGGEEPDAERDKAMLHDSIDRMDAAQLARMVEAYRKLKRNGAAPRRERAG